MENNIILPQQYIQNMKQLLKSDFDSYISSLNSEPVHGIRLNTTKCEDKEILTKLGVTERVPFCSNGYILPNSKIGKHPYHISGLVYVQEPSSMLAVCASGLAEERDKNLSVLDLCASPGGKSGQIAEMLNGQGVLVSNEIEPKRARVLQGNIERMGYSNVIVTSTSPDKLAQSLVHQFDYVFVDAPCGGEGMFRKDPDTISQWKAERLESNAKRQKDILIEANKMLKPNGKLIYSTCTFSPIEDENVVEWFVNEFGYSLILPHQSILDNTAYIHKPECRRFYPFLAKGEGQFVCVMQKPNEEMQISRQIKITKIGSTEQKLINEFVSNTFNLNFAPNYAKLGNNYYIINQKLQNMLGFMQKLPIISAGITIGSIEKGRFIPHNNLTALGQYAKQKIKFSVDDPLLYNFLHGEQLDNVYGLKSGYAFICIGNYPIGLVRVSGNALKNCFPKGLRI